MPCSRRIPTIDLRGPAVNLSVPEGTDFTLGRGGIVLVNYETGEAFDASGTTYKVFIYDAGNNLVDDEAATVTEQTFASDLTDYAGNTVLGAGDYYVAEVSIPTGPGTTLEAGVSLRWLLAAVSPEVYQVAHGSLAILPGITDDGVTP